MRLRPTPLAIALATAAILFTPRLAHASAYTEVLRAYEHGGSVAPCQFTSRQLDAALSSVDTYGAQYFQDFTGAVQAALSARAGGACPPVARAPGTVPPASLPPLRLGPLAAATGAGPPAPFVIIAVVCALLLAGRVLGIALVRSESNLPEVWAQASGEACVRAGDLVAALRDRVRRH